MATASARRSWCGSGLSAHCPFHDNGDRFSCHRASSYRGCVDVEPAPVCGRLAEKVLFFVGDSLTFQHYRTTLCHVHAAGFRKYNSWKLPGPEIGPRTSPRVGVSCIGFVGCTAFCWLAAGSARAGEPSVEQALGFLAASRDVSRLLRNITSGAPLQLVVVANEGLWWTHDEAERRARAAAALWAGRASNRSLRGLRGACLLWRETSPSHFNTPGGVFPQELQGREPATATAAEAAALASLTCEAGDATGRTASPWDGLSRGLEDAYALPTVRVWKRSAPHWDKHVDTRCAKIARQARDNVTIRHDCLHWCTPGIVDLWVGPLLEAVAERCGGV